MRRRHHLPSRKTRVKKDCLPLTKETIKAAFDFLCTTPPFNSWNLDSDDFKFMVAKHPTVWGWHLAWGRGKNRARTIAVSSRMVGHTSTLMTTVAHEALHAHLDLTGQAKGVEHNAAFKRYAEEICRIHGFDRKCF